MDTVWSKTGAGSSQSSLHVMLAFLQVCGYKGPIYMTYPTRAIAPIMLEDYHKVKGEVSDTGRPQACRSFLHLEAQSSDCAWAGPF